LWEREGMASAARWPPNPGAILSLVVGKKGAKDFASDVKKNIPLGTGFLSEIHAWGATFELPLQSQLF